jgi:hypothetical protein
VRVTSPTFSIDTSTESVTTEKFPEQQEMTFDVSACAVTVNAEELKLVPLREPESTP